MPHESTIKVYRSSTSGSIPTGLTDGELAANLADGRIFVGNGNEVVNFESNPYNNVGASGSGIELVSAYDGSIHFSVPKRTNLVLYSHDFVAAGFPNSWLAFSNNGSAPYPTITNLDNDSSQGWQGGATGGFQIEFLNPPDANNGVYQEIRTPHLVTGEYYTLSCWVRSNSGETKFRFADYNYTTNVLRYSDKFIATINPQRFSYVFRPESRTNFSISNGDINSSGTIRVWGVQLERGTSPSSPIRSDGTETTSSASILSFASSASSVAGVTGFNGLTGNVSLTGHTGGAVRVVNNNTVDIRIASTSLTGVAAFNSTYYQVSGAGLVTPTTPFQTTGDTVSTVSGSGISVTKNSSGAVVSNIGVTGIGFGNNDIGLTGKINLTAGNGLNLTRSGNTLTYSAQNFEFQDSFAVASASLLGIGTFTITGGTGISTVMSASKDEIRISSRIAEVDGSVGVASFDSTYFQMSGAGRVLLANAYQVTGDTVQAGHGIAISSSKTIFNTGVTGFNGLTGNVSLTGHTGGAVQVVENNIVTARIADTSLTGVAAFNSTYYSVSAAGLVTPTTPFQTTGDTVSTVAGSGITVTKNSSGAVVSNIGVTGIGFGNNDIGLTGKINLTAGTDISLIRSGNTITINYTGSPSSGGDTVSAGDSIQVVRSGTNVTLNNVGITGIAFGTSDPGLTGRVILTGNAASGIVFSRATNSNTVTLVNVGVTGFNGLTGNVSLTGHTGGAVRVVNNNTVDIRIADTSATGVAAFNSTYYQVSGAGLVTPTTPFQTTGDTVRANFPIRQTISGKRVVLDIDQPTCWDPFNAHPENNGFYNPRPSSGILVERPGATFGLSGACPAFWHDHFLLENSAYDLDPNIGEVPVNRDDFCVFLRTGGPGGLLQSSPFGASGSGIGTTGTTSGILKYFYLDINNLETATNTISSSDNVLVYDTSETGEVKTKKATVSKLFLDNDTLFSSLSPDQLKRNAKSSAIEFEIVLGNVSSDSLGLINGASAHSYITKNTVGSINGCTGQITITGTVNEVIVTNNCPTIVIGLPDNVMVPYISISGGTFTETVSANLFIGSIAGGTF